MQRIAVNIDLNDNEVLDKEIEKAIQGAVKARGRTAVDDFIEKSVDYRIESKFKELLNGHGTNTPLSKLVNYRVDSLVTNELMDIKISQEDLRRAANEKLKDIDTYITEALDRTFSDPKIAAKINTMMEKHVKNYVTETFLNIITNYSPTKQQDV